MVEFRCYPDDAATGLNGFDINLAANSSSRPTSGLLDRRVHTGTNLHTINPDTSTSSTGGFNLGANGQTTYGRDNSFYLGALGLRVPREPQRVDLVRAWTRRRSTPRSATRCTRSP
ncbi:MAG: hypothetical protein R3F17_11135 [Planctomycetota bacterium]